MSIKLSIILNITWLITLIDHTFTIANPIYIDSRCSNNTEFTRNSIYQTNLNSLFLNLTSKAATSTSGTTVKNGVYGLFLCRNDLTTTTCKECVLAATNDLSRSYCPMKMAGVIWYTECMVRYSSESFFGKMEVSPKVIISNSQNLTENITHFTEVFDNAMNDLIVHSANNSFANTFYANAYTITRFKTLNVFSQCTPDLTENECTRCLMIATSQLPVSIAGSVLQPSCNVWYEVYQANISSISPSNNSETRYHTGRRRAIIEVIIATIVPVVTVSVAVMTLFIMIKRAKKLKPVVRNDVADKRVGMESVEYDLRTIQFATNDFSEDNLLGQLCSYGKVYKGTLSDGTEIAVRTMSYHHPNFVSTNFINGALSLGKLQHRNLQRLLGFCSRGEEKFLVFEYMPFNLTHYLLAPKNKRLDWGTRFEIIKGVARGMLYLHQDSRLRIVHRDIKSDKILLDDDMNPKIADFSLAMILHGDQPKELSPIGKSDYICPEYLNDGRLSVQSDVYSFGILVLEIINGTTCIEFCKTRFDTNLLTYARNTWEDGRVVEFVDEGIRGSGSIDQIKRCMQLGLLCAEDSRAQRPTMAKVMLMLDSHSFSNAGTTSLHVMIHGEELLQRELDQSSCIVSLSRLIQSPRRISHKP